MKLLHLIHTLIPFSRHRSTVADNLTPTEPAAYIYRLPVELLQRVFLFIVNDTSGCPIINNTSKYTSISLDVTSPPLVLARVCHFWRVVAYSTPGVWSRIQIVLPEKAKPLKPFLPYFIQCWLDRSGRLPLTLNITDRRWFTWRRKPGRIPAADSQLLDILFSESQRWETVVLSSVKDWHPDFNTPQLKTLECHHSNIRRFNAPKLSSLSIHGTFSRTVPVGQPTLTGRRAPITCKDLRHIHILAASAVAICSTIASFPNLETIVVDELKSCGYVPAPINDLVMLKSMTIPLCSSLPDNYRQELIKIFTVLHLPMLRKLTLLGSPEKPQVDWLLAMLGVASFQVPVVEFHILQDMVPSTTPLNNTYVENIVPLLSFVGEVIFCGIGISYDRENQRRIYRHNICT
ncbi:uncharacterized protein HD556DRAFT_1361739 [Suillus plorans]|uniref:F-box domain-containing protein n=1 Tax=Suillus plorans TaxID=116603 RepID=A0A9P7AX99_9AGAM|nr:uncharacterized protein HD556DRAFT_1361739 [Suillus plorans]KAG1796449.1 hypothetical protein HD556DRAFT_1361739 [Suillus plorans]